MNTGKLNFIVFIFIILLGGGCCRQVDEQALHCINFQEAIKDISEVKLSEYVSSLKYTPIETHRSAPLGEIRQWFTTNDSLMFFVSPDLQRCIHVFSKDGKYIKDIGSKGNGPGEYLAVRTMTVIPENNTLFVEGGVKSVTYSLDDGRCISNFWYDEFFDKSKDAVQKYKGKESITYNMSIWSIVRHNGHIYTVAGDNTTLDQYFLKVKSDFTLGTIIPMRQTTLSILLCKVVCGIVYLYDDKINVMHGLQDTIYTWENKSLQPRIIINFGDIPSIKTMPQIKKTHPILSPNTDHLIGKYGKIAPSSQNIFTETDNAIIGSVFLPVDIVKAHNLKKVSEFVYDKKTRKTKIIKHSGELEHSAFTNDIDGGMPFWPVKRIGDKLYQFVDAGTFIEMSKKYNSPRMKEIAATLTEESNPVMIEATLK